MGKDDVVIYIIDRPSLAPLMENSGSATALTHVSNPKKRRGKKKKLKTNNLISVKIPLELSRSRKIYKVINSVVLFKKNGLKKKKHPTLFLNSDNRCHSHAFRRYSQPIGIRH